MKVTKTTTAINVNTQNKELRNLVERQDWLIRYAEYLESQIALHGSDYVWEGNTETLGQALAGARLDLAELGDAVDDLVNTQY